MQASDAMRSLGTISIMVAAICGLIVGLLLILLAWNTDRRRMFRYPPATALSVGFPILLVAIHAITYHLSGHEWLPYWLERGSFIYEVFPLLSGIAWLNLLILLTTGRLIPEEWRQTHKESEYVSS